MINNLMSHPKGTNLVYVHIQYNHLCKFLYAMLYKLTLKGWIYRNVSAFKDILDSKGDEKDMVALRIIEFVAVHVDVGATTSESERNDGSKRQQQKEIWWLRLS